MKGTIRVRSNKAGQKRYYCQVYAGLDPRTGKKRYLTATATSEREAHRAIHRLVEQLEAGNVPRSRATLTELIDAWMKAAGPPGEYTRTVYEGFIANHVADGIGRTRVSKLRAEDLDHWYAELRLKGLAPASVRKLHNIVRGALTQGVKWGWVSSNAATMSSPPAVPKSVVATPRPAAVREMIDGASAVDPSFGVYLRLAAVTGARPGEMCGLRWSDLHRDSGELSIERRVVRTKPEPLVKDLTKTGKTRRIPLDQRTLDALADHRQKMEDRAGEFEAQLVADAYMFTDEPDGTGFWRPDSVSRRFRTLRDRGGWAAVPLYGLRHQAATTLIDRGVDAKTVSERLGNSVVTVLGTYTRARTAADRGAAATIANALDGD